MAALKAQFKRCLVIFILMNIVWCQEAVGCRYTVRDVGFVDLGQQYYQLYFCYQKMPPDSMLRSLEEAHRTSLANSNLVVEFVDINRQQSHRVIEIINQETIQQFPSAVLFSPQDQILIFPLSDSRQLFETEISSVIDMVMASPARTQIIEDIIDNFCILLMLSAKNESKNKKVRNLVAEISASFGKPISLIEIPREKFNQEKILLWSLGLNVEDIQETHLVVLHGKCRRIGPGLMGKGITDAALYSILTVLDADCECGLDRSWMMGAMLPAIWNQNQQRRVMEMIGFDAENPLVKMEVARILGQTLSPQLAARSLAIRSKVNESELTANDSLFISTNALIILIGITVMVFGAGIIIVWYGRRRPA